MTDPLTEIFNDFRAEVAPHVHPAGVDDAREKVRTRQRNRTVAAGVLAAIVVAIPITIGAITGAGTHGPPAGTPTPRVSSSSGVFFRPGLNLHPSNKAPAGGISEAALYDSEIDLPAWPADPAAQVCPAGRLQFTGGGAEPGREPNAVWISKVAYADVDRDGSDETFVRVFCQDDQPVDFISQVIGLTKGAGGSIRTLGQVTAQTGEIADICDIRAGSDGTIETKVLDVPVPWQCALPGHEADRWVQAQWRTFSWNGSSFVQSGGPTQFPVNPYVADLALTAGDLVLNRQANGHYVGTMTLTVRNLGPSAIPYHTDTYLSAGMTLVDAPAGCSVVPPTSGGISDLICKSPKQAAGTISTVTVKIEAPKRYRVDNWKPQSTSIPEGGYNDPSDTNNEPYFAIKFKD